MAKPIEDYGMIGECETAALVGRDGSIDWLCWPRFDSGAVFAALLGDAENGRWSIAPADAGYRVSRRYRGNTLILETEFEAESGAVTLIDFMPLRSHGAGHLDSHRPRPPRPGADAHRIRAALRLRRDRALDHAAWATTTLQAVAGPDMVVLHAHVMLEAEGYRHRGEFTVAAGETRRVLAPLRPVPSCCRRLRSIRWRPWKPPKSAWEKWSRQCRRRGECSEAVMRSAITLKALTYRPTGGIVAAPTTSLPETLGGVRNWDYRFCWLRDATFTLLALMNAGFNDEASAWRAWLRRAVAGDPAQVQIMYGIAGERRLDEWTCPGCPAMRAPARCGSAMPRQASSRSTSMARSWMRCSRRVSPGCEQEYGELGPAMRAGRRIWRRSGRSPTKASGRFAAAAGISPIRR